MQVLSLKLLTYLGNRANLETLFYPYDWQNGSPYIVKWIIVSFHCQILLMKQEI